jgi:drug/metabolite transporter (DMT)-like permease
MSGRAWLALLTVYVVWGSTYLAIKWAVQTMPAFGSAAVRFIVAGGLLGIAALMRNGRSGWRMEAAQWRNAAVCGVLMLAGGNGLVVLAETRVPSGLAALLVAVVPLWMIVLRGAIGDRTPMLTMAGVLAGLAGAAVLLLPGSGGSNVHVGYALLVVLAALSWAAGSVLVVRARVPDDPAVMSSIEMLAGGVVLLIASAGRGELADLHLGDISGKSWFSLAYLVVFGSIVAFSAYVYALGNGPTSLVATYAYVNPLVAVFLGVLLDHEHLTTPELAGGGVIVASVGVVVNAEGRHRRRTARLAAAATGAAGECTAAAQ